MHDPWITKGILQSLRNQKKLYIKMLGNKTEETIKNYRIYRNKLKSLIMTNAQNANKTVESCGN